jgi:anti-anti-sigma regulatory factor
MAATRFCDLPGARALVRAHKRATANGAELRLVVPSARVLRVLAILGLDSRPATYPSLQEAPGCRSRSETRRGAVPG